MFSEYFLLCSFTNAQSSEYLLYIQCGNVDRMRTDIELTMIVIVLMTPQELPLIANPVNASALAGQTTTRFLHIHTTEKEKILVRSMRRLIATWPQHGN
jgi:hypothetical protein